MQLLSMVISTYGVYLNANNREFWSPFITDLNDRMDLASANMIDVLLLFVWSQGSRLGRFDGIWEWNSRLEGFSWWDLEISAFQMECVEFGWCVWWCLFTTIVCVILNNLMMRSSSQLSQLLRVICQRENSRERVCLESKFETVRVRLVVVSLIDCCRSRIDINSR